MIGLAWRDFTGGLIAGVILGMMIGPILRVWLTRRAWRKASREARLTDEVLEWMERSEAELSEGSDGSATEERWPRSR